MNIKGETLPQVSVSASRNSEGKVHISLCNIDHKNGADLDIELRGIKDDFLKASGTILTGDQMNIHNTFEQPDAIEPKQFKDMTILKDKLSVQLPAMSVVTIVIES